MWSGKRLWENDQAPQEQVGNEFVEFNIRTMPQLIQEGVVECRPIKSNKSKRQSPVWPYFKRIYYLGDALDFVQCRLCSRPLTHTSVNGTTGLKNHVERCLLQNGGTLVLDQVMGEEEEIKQEGEDELLLNE